MLKNGEVVGWKDGAIWLKIPYEDEEEAIDLLQSHEKDVLIELDDGYSITQAQRRKAYVLLSAISLWWSDTPLEVVKETTKMIFQGGGHTLKETFSLSNCTREEARLYITWLLDFCILHDVPIDEPAYKVAEDIERYVYMCLMKKKCAVCGVIGKGRVHLHHVDTVGAHGGSREKISHIGLRALPLCAKHHSEIHSNADFLKQYILVPVKIDERIADRYRLRKKAKKETL